MERFVTGVRGGSTVPNLLYLARGREKEDRQREGGREGEGRASPSPNLPWSLLPSYPVLPSPTPAYTVFYCHPTTAYLLLHWILLPAYQLLPSRTQPIPSNYILSYLVLHWTLLRSYPVLPHPTLTQSYQLPHPTGLCDYCHPTIQPYHPTRLLLPSYPILPSPLLAYGLP